MRKTYDIHFIAIGTLEIQNGIGRCHDVENKLQSIADNCDDIMCVSPFIIPTVPSKIARGLQAPQSAAGIVPGFMVVSMRLEEEPEPTKEPEQCQSDLQRQAMTKKES